MAGDSIPREYLQLPAGPFANFAEIYGKRLLYPFTCPFQGERNDSCACTEAGSPHAGLTRFAKVRIDLYNMKIDLEDFTFAETVYGEMVPYASAGDCYSAVSCPQVNFHPSPEKFCKVLLA